VKELSERAGRDLSTLDLHRPHVDAVTWVCTKCGGKMTRVPDLIDVWFDSGSMPVAQWHYPFENKEKFANQFPADYICEAVDQTRGWFYTLHAISTLLFDQLSFKNVICLGHVVDADGRKMSKHLGNVSDPWEVLDQSGADAFRWYFYTSSPPNAERRFAASMVTDVVKNFTLTLWNVYSFFVTYANLDNPELTRVMKPANDLDKWMFSSLNTLVRDVTKAYETYDVPGATRPIEAFVESLSTWYLRRSRRRFWKSESDSDKQAAYYTLYTVLVTLAKLLAPAMPFLADEMYRNLVCSIDSKAPESVHLAKWPKADESRIDETLNREMTLVMKLVSLGHNARQKANRKVRQPLSEAAFTLTRPEERHAVETYASLITDELNVKKVRLLDASGEVVSFVVKPLSRQLGQKYGNKFPGLAKAISASDPAISAPLLLAGKSVQVTSEGVEYSILPEEVEVRALAKEGFAVANDGAYLAALITELTPDLVREGLAREFVRRVQDLRKTANLDVADRIRVYVTASEGLKNAIEANRDYVIAETLTVELSFVIPDNLTTRVTDEFDGEKIILGLIKA
jgi:isoleucyl-tRNA synthetase